jgi:predicted metalloprotease
MSFDPNARLDPGQVRDVRGRTGRGGALVAGGGGIGLILAIAYLLLGGDPGALIGTQPGGGQVTGPESTTLEQECRTGSDAAERPDCRIVGYVNSIQEFWDGALPQQLNTDYPPTDTVIFEEVISTGCGTASSQVGPFYCPSDQHVYLDLGFFKELEARFGAQGGRFAEAYVVAHEYGHHIENVLGVLGQAQTGETGEGSAAVRIELMADCLAGVWAHHAEGTAAVADVTEADVASALDAAAAVGDDRIQERTQGQVNPEAWTHGSAEQRQDWFNRGWQSGDANTCDTFAE